MWPGPAEGVRRFSKWKGVVRVGWGCLLDLVGHIISAAFRKGDAEESRRGSTGALVAVVVIGVLALIALVAIMWYDRAYSYP